MNNYAPKISCIVPVYKSERFLKQCVNSILSQSYSNFELLLIDDGSPDKSGFLCDELQKKDIRISVIHKINGGVSDARNVGINNAKGDYICFVDSDDIIENNHFKSLISPMINTPSCQIVISGIKRELQDYTLNEINYNNTPSNIFINNHHDFIKVFVEIKKNKSFDVFLNSPVNKLFAKQLLEDCKFDTEMITSEDYVFCLKVFEKIENAIFINQSNYIYKYNNSSAIYKYNPNLLNDTLKSFSETLVFNLNNFNLLPKSFLDSLEINGLYSVCTHTLEHMIIDKQKVFNRNAIRKNLNIRILLFSMTNPKKFLLLLAFKLKLEKILVIIFKNKFSKNIL